MLFKIQQRISNFQQKQTLFCVSVISEIKHYINIFIIFFIKVFNDILCIKFKILFHRAFAHQHLSCLFKLQLFPFPDFKITFQYFHKILKRNFVIFVFSQNL